MAAAAVLIPTQYGDSSASLPSQQARVIRFDNSEKVEGLGSGDSSMVPGFLSPEEADAAFAALQDGGEIEYQQWYHMPNKKGRLEPLRRVKRALATPTAEGLIPHYRFPVNDQQRYGVISPMTATVELMRQRASALFGVDYNHSVVLLYRSGEDCIGYHKDKTLDLDESAPIVSISLGRPRLYALRDDIYNPTFQQEVVLPHGGLLALGPRSNIDCYHSIRPESDAADPAAALLPRVSITFRRVLTFRHPLTGEICGKGADYQSQNWPEPLRGKHVLLQDEPISADEPTSAEQADA